MSLPIAATTVSTRLHHQPHCICNPLAWQWQPSSTSIRRRSSNWRRRKQYTVCCLITDPASFQVGRLIGTYGFMNITSYSNPTSTIDYSDLGQLRTQDVGEGTVNIRLYEGRVTQGTLRGASVVFKVYPGRRAGSVEADMMAANELNAHALLQSSPKGICQNLFLLVGGFETKTGEQWLAFRNDGKYSAADYAKRSSEKMLTASAREQISWNYREMDEKIKRKRFFVVKLLHGAMTGLAFMHENERLHQSLGPSSVILNTIAEREAPYMIPRLRDLAFSVDISYPDMRKQRMALHCSQLNCGDVQLQLVPQHSWRKELLG